MTDEERYEFMNEVYNNNTSLKKANKKLNERIDSQDVEIKNLNTEIKSLNAEIKNLHERMFTLYENLTNANQELMIKIFKLEFNNQTQLVEIEPLKDN